MSYLERFIRGCFVQPKFHPKSLLTLISCYFSGGAFIFIILGFSNSLTEREHSFVWLFCLFCLIFVLLNVLAFFIKFYTELDWPLWFTYISVLAVPYMIFFFAVLIFGPHIELLFIGEGVIFLAGVINFLYLLGYHKLFNVDPVVRPKPYQIILFGLNYIYIFLTLFMFILEEIKQNEIFLIYGTIFFSSSFSVFTFMSFTRVMDFWQKPVETGQRYGDSMKKLARKKK